MSETPPPFVIYSSPRSRSFWLSKFLTYGGWTCGHDENRYIRSMDDVKSWFSQPFTGTVETSSGCWWRLIHDMRPDVKIVVIRRPVDEIVASFLRTNVEFNEQELRNIVTKNDAKLQQIAMRLPDALVFNYEDLVKEEVCAKIFNHCLNLPNDPTWYAILSQMNLQCDLAAMFRYINAHERQLLRVANQVKQKILQKITRRRVVSDGFVFQQESFDKFYEDGKKLFDEHLIQVGDEPDGGNKHNIKLMRRLACIGCLHITTARQNGRMFGYLMVVIGPSLASPDEKEAMNAIFYTSPMARNIGVKLQRASAQFLADMGVDTLYMRVNHRGDGTRLGPLYKRIGAEECGAMYALGLKG